MTESYPIPQLLSILPAKFRPWAVNRSRKYTNPLVWQYAIGYCRLNCRVATTIYLDKALRTAALYLRTVPQMLLVRVKALERWLHQQPAVHIGQNAPKSATPAQPGDPSPLQAWKEHVTALVRQGKVSASRVPSWCLSSRAA